MKILITGATGLIGSKLCQFLIHKHSLIALTRSPVKAASVLPPGTHFITSLDEVDFNDIDAVINLAGEPIADGRWTRQRKQEIRDSRINITRAISSAISAATTPPALLISGSAVGVYGRQPSDVTIKEDFTAHYDEFSHQLCRDWEDAALAAKSEQTRVCILRTGIVLSKTGGALVKMLPPFRLGLGGPIGKGEQVMSWIHIDDMVQAILFILKHDEIEGIVNATAPNPVSNKLLSQELAKTLSRPCIFTIPPIVLKLVYGEMSDLLLFGQRVVPQKLLDTGYRFRHDSIDEALRSLNL
ncbi:TIGR01777 family oxidoreductase [Pseudoalteromonas peptidolytica]|uniref:TIGR01777 family oxidoreductase n=1 Tax=Pseudoalteromonas peptidolytica TaxID=61150 RepID=UPI00298EB70E|nr:TIGR01777 family oxidoreductase [Pseudoalteromonas peptidolytica]MDW7549920.1 TIGR01777 family oxidoreductase [Pseudoalteromonas peptidolytica]